MTRWIEIADRVFARRHEELDQTLGLIVGNERCLVVDSGTDEVHGAEWQAAIRSVTPLPVTLLITHAHWDHFFGTAQFTPCPVLAHPVCQREIAENAEEHRARGLRHYGGSAPIGDARVVVPDTEITTLELDLGGKVARLSHPGRGHTGGDIVVYLPETGTLFAGDLVEQGAPPAIGKDAYPLDWPSTMDTLLAMAPEVVVPGHGDPVDAAFVATQRNELAAVAELYRAVRAGELGTEEAVQRAPYPDGYVRQILSA